jgi:hypothetical protein
MLCELCKAIPGSVFFAKKVGDEWVLLSEVEINYRIAENLDIDEIYICEPCYHQMRVDRSFKKEVKIFQCCDCKKNFEENNVLATGFNDENGNPEVICGPCENKRGGDFKVNDGLT